MIIATRPNRKIGLRFVDIYFPDSIDSGRLNADIAVVLQASAPARNATPFHTLKIDLQKEPEDILAGMSKNNRYKIRRADKRDPVEVDANIKGTGGNIAEFAIFFDEFAITKGLAPCNRDRLRALAAHDALSITRVTHENGELLTAHVNIVDHENCRARLLYSASLYRNIDDSGFRNLIGRANRLLHWREILHFRDLGLKWYDLGGIGGPDASDQQRRIARFKLGFGGQKVIEYNHFIGITMMGKIALAIKRLARI